MKFAIVEIHDVSPYYEREVREAVQLLDEVGIDRFSLLLIPNFNGKHPIESYREFVAFLRGLKQEMVLHGLTHQGRTSLRHLLFTYKEGEFGQVEGQETARRIEIACQKLREVSLKSKFFVPPAWIGNPWLEEVLSAFGFKGVAYRNAIKILSKEQEFFSPAITFSNRFLLSYLSLTAIPVLFRLAKKFQIVRLALHTKDFRDERKFELWRKMLIAVKKQRRLIGYEDLLK